MFIDFVVKAQYKEPTIHRLENEHIGPHTIMGIYLKLKPDEENDEECWIPLQNIASLRWKVFRGRIEIFDPNERLNNLTISVSLSSFNNLLA